MIIGRVDLHPLFLQWLQPSTDRLAKRRLNWPDGVDHWGPLLEQADEHGLVPLLNRAMKDSGREAIPHEICDKLKRRSLQIAAKNLLLLAELESILQACRQRSISCVPFRGVVLSEELYGDLTIRPTGDIDLLVRPEELSQLRECLSRLGFLEVEARPGFAQDFYYTLEFFKEGHVMVIVEPHWTIAYPPCMDRIDMEAVWGRCTTGTFAGVDCRLLSPEDLLIHLCLHYLHHGRSAPFLWLCDIDRLVRGQQLDWQLVAFIVRDARLELFVHSVLNQVDNTLQSPIPRWLLQKTAMALSNREDQHLLSLLMAGPTVKGPEKIYTMLRLRGLRKKLRYVRSFLLPSTDFIRAQYGVSSPFQVATTYLKRFCVLSWQGLKTLARFYP